VRFGLRKKMFLISLGVSVVIASAIGSSIYLRSSRLFFDTFRRDKLALARAVAASLGGEIRRFVTPDALEDPSYQRSLHYLRTVKEQNPDVSYMYVVVYDGEAGHHVYTLDANVNPFDTLWIESEPFSLICRFHEDGTISVEHRQRVYVDDFVLEDTRTPVEVLQPDAGGLVSVGGERIFSVVGMAPLVLDTPGGVLRDDAGLDDLSTEGTIRFEGTLSSIRYTLGKKGYPESIPGEPFNADDPESVAFLRELEMSGRDEVSDEFEESAFGDSIFVYTPVRDAGGETAGILGIEVWAREVKQYRRSILLVAFLVSALTFLLSVIIYTLVIERLVIRSIRVFSRGAREIAAGHFDHHVDIRRSDEIGALADTFNGMADGLKEREVIKDLFGKYVQREVAEMVMRSGIKLGGEKQSATVLFSDIRRFTALAESLDPERVVSVLNRYFSSMVECIIAKGGVLDKYIGDALMVHFGILGNRDAHAADAVAAAVEMVRALGPFNDAQRSEGEPVLHVGIGIHTGELVAGNIGSPNRMEYTVIGDTVNLASRAEGLTKVFGAPIVITESVLDGLGKGHGRLIRPLDLIVVKGRREPVLMFEVFDADGETLRERKLRTRETIGNAVALYRERRFGEAREILRECLSLGDDPLVRHFLAACDHYLVHPPAEKWDGSAVMTGK
jgi:class 3 adenylate cyclase